MNEILSIECDIVLNLVSLYDLSECRIVHSIVQYSRAILSRRKSTFVDSETSYAHMQSVFNVAIFYAKLTWTFRMYNKADKMLAKERVTHSKIYFKCRQNSTSVWIILLGYVEYMERKILHDLFIERSVERSRTQN